MKKAKKKIIKPRCKICDHFVSDHAKDGSGCLKAWTVKGDKFDYEFRTQCPCEHDARSLTPAQRARRKGGVK